MLTGILKTHWTPSQPAQSPHSEQCDLPNRPAWQSRDKEAKCFLWVNTPDLIVSERSRGSRPWLQVGAKEPVLKNPKAGIFTWLTRACPTCGLLFPLFVNAIKTFQNEGSFVTHMSYVIYMYMLPETTPFHPNDAGHTFASLSMYP